MRFKGLVLLFSVILILAGCGSKSGLSKNDIGIRKIEDPNAKVVYGMSRADAEKVLGKGEQMGIGYNYENGVRAYFREDKVVGVSLDDAANGIFETISGAEIGMLESEFKKIYGDKFVDDGGNLGYFYNTKTESFSTKGVPKASSEEEAEQIFVIDVRFDENGYADRISLLDHLMGQLGK